MEQHSFLMSADDLQAVEDALDRHDFGKWHKKGGTLYRKGENWTIVPVYSETAPVQFIGLMIFDASYSMYCVANEYTLSDDGTSLKLTNDGSSMFEASFSLSPTGYFISE